MSNFKIILSFIFTAIIGFLVSFKLPVNLLPDNTLPVLTVNYAWPDASPELIEAHATSLLENPLSQIPQLKKIYSVSNYSQGLIELTFDIESNIEFKKFEVASIIRRVYPKLNPKVSYPSVQQRSREDKIVSPLLVYHINAQLTPFQIRKTVQDVFVPAIARHEGVNEVMVQGAQEIELIIAYDHKLLKNLGIHPGDIAYWLEREFSSFFPGSLITSAHEKFTIRGGRSAMALRDIEVLMLPTNNGNHVPLHSLAKVYWQEGKQTQYFRINGLNSVTLAIYADAGVNRLKLAEEIQTIVQEQHELLPEGFSVIEDYNDTDFFREELDRVMYRAMISFAILIVFLLISYRNFRHILILLSGVLVSLGLTAFVAWLMSITVNLYTLAGITIALGIMIDNSIVVLDHLKTRRDSKILRAVLAASLTTILSVMLVFLLPERERLSLIDFYTTISVAVACSALTAVFYTPALKGILLPHQTYSNPSISELRRKVWWFSRYTLTIQFLTRYRKVVVVICVLSFGLPVFLLPSKLNNQSWYNNTIGSAVYQKSIRPYIDKILGGSLRLFINNVAERSGHREPQRMKLYVQAKLPHGNTLDDLDRVIRGMEYYLSTCVGIDTYVTQVFSGQNGTIQITFAEEAEHSLIPSILKANLIARSLVWGGVEWNIYGVGLGFSNSLGEEMPSFKVELTGYDYDQLDRYTHELEKKLIVNERVRRVNKHAGFGWDEESTEQLVLTFDRETYGPISQLAEELNEAVQITHKSFPILFNNVLTKAYLNNDRDIVSTYELLETPLVLADSQRIRLSALAQLNREISASSIHKKNRQYIRVLSFDFTGNVRIGKKYLDLILADLGKESPPGYRSEDVSLTVGWIDGRNHFILLILLLATIFLTTSIIFENCRQSFYITLTIPLSFIGLFIGFSLFNFYFDQGGYAAFILMGALVANASIYIVNDINNTCCRNADKLIIKAAAGKFRPIVLTIFSTCLGLFPFILNGENEVFWFALSVGTISGLLFSLLVVFFCIPVFLQKKYN